ncbi:hypothetical protein K432DRAFT_381860 [Lepidopterella palustris CBS 459.81]|uniref:Uncharacterized protein n=1 Tax=Lepidopterella palustris CBS 459.81 TaxID=1314670 RepID=A0A8E2JFQ7_9PEZI|nr:hypothetical protein K432DRAFT_381860 [Lepidopterella palustris CBS 459.81]
MPKIPTPAAFFLSRSLFRLPIRLRFTFVFPAAPDIPDMPDVPLLPCPSPWFWTPAPGPGLPSATPSYPNTGVDVPAFNGQSGNRHSIQCTYPAGLLTFRPGTSTCANLHLPRSR